MNVGCVAVLLAVAVVGCSKTPRADEWWVPMTAPGKTVIKVLQLEPHEKKSLVIEGTGKTRLGVLVRRVWEMKEDLGKSGNSRGGVFLTQDAAGNYVGTAYSASNLFDLALGRSFTIENRSNTGTDVVVYSDPKL